MKLPKNRISDIVVQELEKEILVYDLKTHHAYNLNETLAIVYQACDGKTTFADLKSKYKFTDDLIFLALDELNREGLVESNYASPFSGMNRRQVIKQVGLASMVALPLIAGLVAPQASQAASGVALLATGTICSTNTQCASGTCQGLCFGSAGQTCTESGSTCTTTGICLGINLCNVDLSPCNNPGGSCTGRSSCIKTICT